MSASNSVVPPLRAAMHDSCRKDETAAAARILGSAEIPADQQDAIAERARGLVAAVRQERLGKGGIDAFLHEYALSSPEGVALLCLAEALLRIPDAETVDRLIRDKIGEADWERHLGHSQSIFVNASTWALMLTGRLLRHHPAESDLRAALRSLVARSGEPVVRQAVTAAMHILGRQFVMGRTIDEAVLRGSGSSSTATGIPTTCLEKPRIQPRTPHATPSLTIAPSPR
jgi:RHH-type transcriptional regulator, proline utilization regulon repressor / proline dehydrogenase / delta 1-pyrroline-5-carboxylate dehydrogenase